MLRAGPIPGPEGGCVDGTHLLVAPWSAGSQFNPGGAARQCVPPSMGIVLSLRGWRPVEGPGDPPSKGLSSTLAKHTHTHTHTHTLYMFTIDFLRMTYAFIGLFI